MQVKFFLYKCKKNRAFCNKDFLLNLCIGMYINLLSNCVPVEFHASEDANQVTYLISTNRFLYGTLVKRGGRFKELLSLKTNGSIESIIKILYL